MSAFPTRPATAMERGQWVLLVLLALLTVSAWTLTVYQARMMDMSMGIVARGAWDPMPEGAAEREPAGGMDGMAMAQPMPNDLSQMAASGMVEMADAAWSWDSFVTFFVAWAVMMAAMMFPAAAPMLLFFHKIAGGQGSRGRGFASTWVFAAGYLLVWLGVGAVTWLLVQIGSDLAGRLGESDREAWAPLALGAVLVVAGLYQLTPLKRVCLDHCRTPINFVMTHWREGRRGALRMGAVHGAYCLGCCWALFAILVAAGVMSLAWMLLLTLVVFVEKVLPVGPRAVHASGAAFLVLGVLVAAGATNVPWSA